MTVTFVSLLPPRYARNIPDWVLKGLRECVSSVRSLSENRRLKPQPYVVAWRHPSAEWLDWGYEELALAVDFA